MPAEFRFTLKAPKRITHDRRLRAADVSESLQGFITAATELGPQLAALLFQLPPNFKKDLVLLNEFLSLLPPQDDGGVRVSQRSRGWPTMSTTRCGRATSRLCIADSETRETPLVNTAGYAYLRLRDEGYGDAEIAHWTETARRLGETAGRCVRLFQARR